MDIIYFALEHALELILTVLLPWALPKLYKLLRDKIENETLEGISVRSTSAVIRAVAYVAQTYTDELKAGRAPDSDGGSKLTDQEKSAAKRAAIEAAKSFLGKKGLDELMWMLGLSSIEGVDVYLGKQIEAVVGASKAPPAAAVAVLSPRKVSEAPTDPFGP